jgi:hypothetical protein
MFGESSQENIKRKPHGIQNPRVGMGPATDPSNRIEIERFGLYPVPSGPVLGSPWANGIAAKESSSAGASRPRPPLIPIVRIIGQSERP